MRMRKKLNLLNLQAFVAYMYNDLEHCLIVAARDYSHARKVASEFLGCSLDMIVVRKTAQRHIRRMETSGVAWRIDTPRYKWAWIKLHARWGILNVDYAALERRAVFNISTPMHKHVDEGR